MAVRLEAVTFDVADPPVVAAFRAGLLGRDVRAEPGGAFLPGDGTQVGLRFAASGTEGAGRPRLRGTKIAWDFWDAPPAGRSRQRFDLVAADPAAEAARLVSLGATRLATRPSGVELADPDGNGFGVNQG